MSIPRNVITEIVTTDQLREGDTVFHYGMVLILGPISTYQDCGVTVYASPGQVQNRDEVQADGLVRGLLYNTYWDDNEGWVTAYSGVWRVQGNDLARWNRVVIER